MYEQCTLEQVCTALQYVDDVDLRETWVAMGMAVKAEFGDAGFDVWDQWSQLGGSYNPSSARATWKSFKRSSSGVGIGSLFKRAIDRGFEFERKELTTEEKTAFAVERAEREKQRAIDQQLELEEIALWHERVSVVATQLWGRLNKIGASKYLGTKKVSAHGVRFFMSGVVVVTHEDRIELIEGRECITQFFAARKAAPECERLPMHYFKKGYFAVPMLDAKRKIWNLQCISPNGEKLFIRNGKKQGCYCLLAPMSDSGVLAVVEGYATGASIFEATGYPVAVAFDAGNLLPACKALRERFPGVLLLVCGDNDVQAKGNPGAVSAQAAANDVGGAWLVPNFEGVAA